jgi:hypothetical protein
MRFIKKLFHGPLGGEPEERPVVEVNQPLYYIDVDETGALFVRLVHATSSGHRDSIRERGLCPITDMRAAIEEYMIDLSAGFRGDCSETQIRELLDFKDRKTRNSEFALLIRPRLECQADVPVIFALPLRGCSEYLRSAAANSIADGGELFRAARRLLETHISRRLQPRFAGRD